MGVVNTTYTFSGTDTITSSKMNNIIDDTTFTSGAVFGTTLEVVTSGQLKVRSQGITSNELAAGSVTSNAIADGTIVNADISASAAIDPSKLGTGAITATATVTTANIVDASVTAPKLNGAQAGTAPVYGARAWAKLNPYVGSVRTGAYKAGTYSRTTSETTVTIVGHGLKTNDKIRLDFTSGTGTDGLYTVTASANANEFVVNHAGAATSGNVTAQFVAIQGSGNISSASWYDNTDNGIVLNFSIPMPDVNYAILTTGQLYPGLWFSDAAEDTIGDTQLNTVNQAHVGISEFPRFTSVVIFG